jgi:hypothetical protein
MFISCARARLAEGRLLLLMSWLLFLLVPSDVACTLPDRGRRSVLIEAPLSQHHRVRDKERRLGDILGEQQDLTPRRRAMLDELVEEHIQQHHNDPTRSLQALSSAGSIQQEVSGLFLSWRGQSSLEIKKAHSHHLNPGLEPIKYYCCP